VADDQVTAEAFRQGVAVSPGSAYYAPGGPTGHLRLSYVAPSTTDEIIQGIERLDQAVGQVL
jgi:DNA-binding transcriptional MocR family regulator